MSWKSLGTLREGLYRLQLLFDLVGKKCIAKEQILTCTLSDKSIIATH